VGAFIPLKNTLSPSSATNGREAWEHLRHPLSTLVKRLFCALLHGFLMSFVY